MIIQFYKPHDHLKDIVSNLMVYNAELDQKQSPAISVHPPVPEQCLYFYPSTACKSYNMHTGESMQHPPCLIVGPVIERVNLSIGHNHIVIRVGFHPGGLYRLLGLPAHELFNHPLDGQDLFGHADEKAPGRDSFHKSACLYHKSAVLYWKNQEVKYLIKVRLNLIPAIQHLFS